jgi:hypothetical protein
MPDLDHEPRRKVIATIGRFTGYGVHFHVTLREQAPLGVHPRERMMKFRARRDADRWIRSVFEREFSPESHELIIRVEQPDTWYYGEGD